MTKTETEILIIGGGPAGMAAALSASRGGTRVAVADDNQQLGGQIWRAEMSRIKSPEAAAMIKKIESGQIEIIRRAQIFGQTGDKRLFAETPDGILDLRFKRLIIATGARELFLPFPGWTLPNVFGAGGLQALVKNGLEVENKRVVVAGSGALLLAVAEYLRAKGAKVLLIAEQSPAQKVYKFGLGLIRHPKKAIQAASLRAKLGSVAYLTDCYVIGAEGAGKLETVRLRHRGKEISIECDFLACGYHLVPNVRLATACKCELDSRGFVQVDEFQQTSVPEIYCAGEPTGIGGVELSLIEGEIAGLAAAGDEKSAVALFKLREKARKFAAALNETFALRDELKLLAGNETIVCRCEDVKFGKLKQFGEWRTAKLQTRCGMGSCQGQICGAATEFLFGWKSADSRPPIFPVSLESLANCGTDFE